MTISSWRSSIAVLIVLVVGSSNMANFEDEVQQLSPELAADIRSAKMHTEELLAMDQDPVARAELIGQLAIIYHAQQMLYSAESAYMRALELDEVYAYRYLLAIIILQRGDTDSAIAHLEQVVLANPEYVPAWYRIGNLELLRGDIAKAETAFENAQKIYANSAAILVGLASAKIAKEDWYSAIELLEKAWVYEPNNGQVAYKLVTAYRGNGDDDKAEQWLNSADASVQLPSLEDPLLVELAGMSRNARFYAKAADWAFQRGDKDAARDALDQATRLEPGNLKHSLKYAAFLELVGEVEEAANELKRFLAIDTEEPRAWFALARLYRDSEDGEAYLQGLVAAQKAVELEQNEDLYRTLAAAMSLQATLYPYAQEHYMQLLERNPENAYYYYWFGLARLAEGHCDGRDALKRAVALRKTWGEAHVATARADAFCGDISSASARLDALARAAADKDIQSAQAFVALLSGDVNGAKMLAEDLLPDPDAKMVMDAIESEEKPKRVFADGSSWWIPPELVN